MIKVRSEVKSYDDDAKALPEPVLVENHWNDSALIGITVNGQKCVVSASDLLAAIKNATNCNRF